MMVTLSALLVWTIVPNMSTRSVKAGFHIHSSMNAGGPPMEYRRRQMMVQMMFPDVTSPEGQVPFRGWGEVGCGILVREDVAKG